MTTDPALRRRVLSDFVGRRATQLAARQTEDSGAKAVLARLRRAVAVPLDDAPDTWNDFYPGLPEEITGHGDRPGTLELAAFRALTLFALHQQSQSRPMHQPGPEHGLGRAIRRLADPNDTLERQQGVMRRFQALTTAEQSTEIEHHLRGLVQLLRAAEVPMDYGQLAKDLSQITGPYGNQVRLRWARDLHAPRRRAAPKGDAPVVTPAGPSA